ncbi:hypothetical protein FRX31_004641 [Thalictrum thalictroides]|uniref:Uncharacterized protein n=1 Tax=Thalictrum thalictroides TaxID=46969 RepID=A0A7J6X815_THATH|nr:hypothetical protein FRX31_004641 [Thalictrum thalictroides]
MAVYPYCLHSSIPFLELHTHMDIEKRSRSGHTYNSNRRIFFILMLHMILKKECGSHMICYSDGIRWEEDNINSSVLWNVQLYVRYQSKLIIVWMFLCLQTV